MRMETITLPATLDSLALISEFVINSTSQAGLDERTAWQVQLAVDEAATNIIQHSYDSTGNGTIELTWWRDGDFYVISLRDFGRPFDPSEVPAPDVTSPLEDRQAGGLGLFLMSRLMDDVSFSFSEQEGNLLVMRKRIGSTATDVRIFTLSGRLDAIGTEAAIQDVDKAIDEGARTILLDLQGVTFLSSSGLRALLLTRKKVLALNGSLSLCELRPEVLEVFEITGFTQVFTIHPTREDALAALQRGNP
jgi:serine/threonine-protein kinase RsbW